MLRDGIRLGLEPVFSRIPDRATWLQQNLGAARYLEVDVRRKDPAPWILAPVLQAIMGRTPLRMIYHSRRGVSERRVSPHAIINVAARLHMRAYDHDKNRHADFVLTRITHAALSPMGAPYVGVLDDLEWAQFKEVMIEEKAQHPDAAAQAGVRLDFDLNEHGQRHMRVRAPLVRYLIDEMGDAYSAPVRVVEANGKLGSESIDFGLSS